MVVKPQHSFRERLGALRNLPPFLRLIWETSPSLTIANGGLRLVRAVLPVAMLFLGKLIIDEVITLASTSSSPPTLRAWWSSGMVDRLAMLIGLEFALAVLSDVM